MIKRSSKSPPTWKDVRARLASFDRTGLLNLVQDLYATHKDNQTFLHARLGLGEDVLKPYKQTIDRWLWPDVIRNQDPSVAKAKQAISHYKKAVGEPTGLAELMVFYCEQAAGFCGDVGYQEESYFSSLVRIFEQALTIANTLPANRRGALLARLDRVRNISHQFGYGVGDDMDSLLAKQALRTGPPSMRR
jgi:hypothetical protein